MARLVQPDAGEGLFWCSYCRFAAQTFTAIKNSLYFPTFKIINDIMQTVTLEIINKNAVSLLRSCLKLIEKVI